MQDERHYGYRVYVEAYNKDKHFKRLINMKLREADSQELKASTGHSVVKGLVESVERSDIVTYVYLYGNRIIALSGAAYVVEPETAVVWAMGTDEVLEHWREVEPLFTEHVNDVLNVPGIEVIGNIIDLRNKAHIRWIKKLGFTMTSVTIKLNGYDFETFYKRRT